MLGKEEDILDKNNDVQKSLVKTGGCVEVTVYDLSISGLREKLKHWDTILGTRASTKETAATGKSVEAGSKL